MHSRQPFRSGPKTHDMPHPTASAAGITTIAVPRRLRFLTQEALPALLSWRNTPSPCLLLLVTGA